jgi:uroporphyrin-III C-methyltransferase
MRNPQMGKVTLVGAGPGDPELLTLRAFRAIEEADAVVYDRLVSEEILDLIPAGTRRIDVGKRPHHHPVPQEEINELLVSLAFQGLNVARLKGGDPLIFGRGSEEAIALREAGIPVSYVPGITAAQGAAASTGVPLTHRGLATGVRYITGHRAKDKGLEFDWASLAREDTTLVVYMGAANIREITSQLVAHGLPAELPVMMVTSATTPAERREVSTLCGVAELAEAKTCAAPVLFIIGHVVSLYREKRADSLGRILATAMAEAHG